jgi:hypothetical protein
VAKWLLLLLVLLPRRLQLWLLAAWPLRLLRRL